MTGQWLSCLDEPSQTFKVKIEHMLSNLHEITQDVVLNKCFMVFAARVSPAELVYIGT